MDVKRLGGFSSHHGSKLACGPEHMAGERELERAFFFREFQERAFSRERIFKRERERSRECPSI